MENHKKILVVEDDLALNKALSTILRKSGFDVLNAENGQVGLDMALKENPDLILLDLLMPIMDGISMLQELRKDTVGKTIPVFILTNSDDTEKVNEAFGAGAYAYFVKLNWRLSDVVKKVKDKLGVAT
jgi:DNA-binding response OmpR family regulator